jgi:hypothetical protein
VISDQGLRGDGGDRRMVDGKKMQELKRSWSQEIFVCGKGLWRPASLKFEGRGELTST